MRRVVGVVGALLALMLVAAPRAVADTVAFTWTDARIVAPVGLATDVDHSMYWTANAAAAKTTNVFAVNGQGKVLAALSYQRATPGPLAVAYDANRIFVLDKGTAATALRVSYLTLSRVIVDGSVGYKSWDFTLPEAGQTAAALIVAPNTQLYVVAQSGRVYKAPATLATSGANKLTKVSDGTGPVTSGYYDTRQSRVVLRSATSVLVLDPATFATTSTVAAPAQAGGRGVAPSLDGESYLLTAGGAGSAVLAVSPATPSPTPGPSTEASSSTPATSTSAVAVSDTGTKASTTGMLVAFGSAAVLALVAAGVALVRR
jgi:hypothetical protein